MNDIRFALTGSLDAIERMATTFRTMVVQANHVVRMPGGFVRLNYDTVPTSVQLVDLPRATNFDGPRAAEVAAKLTNGDWAHGQPVKIVDAIASERERIQGLLAEVADYAAAV